MTPIEIKLRRELLTERTKYKKTLEALRDERTNQMWIDKVNQAIAEINKKIRGTN